MPHNDLTEVMTEMNRPSEKPAKKMATFDARIHRLSSELANQIAAGEVIERPASVLKELLENSLDAGSTQIDIVIEQGGIGLIKVQDNGCGIHQEDLLLALAQHATSKVTSLNDLAAICSFGFRGEALASIASVSKLKLSSCPESQKMGCIIEKSGREDNFTTKPAPRILGTGIEVKELFYNTPARRQFLRSEKTETTYLEEVFKRIALSHPKVGFSIKFSTKTAKQLPRCLSKEAYTRRVAELCGKTFVEYAQYVEAESNGLILKGWIGGKDQLRSNADLQYFYVNGRIIRDKLINHALRQAYQDSYAQGRYPAYILFLELDPASIDVNVHPTKHEVRFREARIVHAFLTYALQETLEASVKPQADSDIKEFLTDENNTAEGNSVKDNIATEKTLAPASAPMLRQRAEYHSRDLFHESQEESDDNASDIFQIPNSSVEDLSCPSPIPSPPNYPNASVQTPRNPLADRAESAADNLEQKFGTPLTLLMGELLVLEKNQEITIVDIRACDAFLLTEQLKGNKSCKNLLIPCAIKIANKRNFDRLEQMLQNLGFQWTSSSIDHILLRAIPAVLSNQVLDIDRTFNKILENSPPDMDSIIKYIATLCSQKTAYTLETAKKIWGSLNSQTCPLFKTIHDPNNHYFKTIELKNLRKVLFS